VPAPASEVVQTHKIQAFKAMLATLIIDILELEIA